MSDKPAAIVTGGSRGIGRAIALELAGLGFDVAISHLDFTADGAPDEAAAAETARQIETLNAACLSVRRRISPHYTRRPSEATIPCCAPILARMISSHWRKCW